MRPGTPGFVGARLVEAREARGLSGIALADMLGVRPQTVTLYEQSKATPSPEVMGSISQKLNLPSSYFLRPVLPKDDSGIFWRSTSAATKTARSRAEKRLIWLKESMEYLREFFDFPQPNVPKFDIPSDFRSIRGEQIEEWAIECRRYWGLGMGPVPDVLAELEANGIIVSKINVGVDNLDAFSQWSSYDMTPYVMLGIDKASAVRSRFDAAHELAHLILHKNLEKKTIGQADGFKIIEDQAHRFASAFLMPAPSFSKEIWGATLDAFMAIKQRWGTSIASMIMRCRYLGIVNEDQEKRLWINLNRRGWRRDEPFDNSIDPEAPRLIRRAIEMLVNERVRGAEQILLETRLSPMDLEELASLPPGYLSGKTAEVMQFPKLKRDDERPYGSGVVVQLDRLRGGED